MQEDISGPRKLTILGKKMTLPTLLIVILSVGTFAAVVSYLSNTATVHATVDSPVNVQVDVGTGWQTDVVAPGTWYGLDTRGFQMQAQNNANNPTSTFNLTATITNNQNNATCADFTAFSVVSSDLITHDVLGEGLCTDDGAIATVKIATQLNAGELKTYNVSLTLGIVQPATYHIAVQAKTV